MQYLTNSLDYTGANLWEFILMPFSHGPAWMLRIPALIASIGALWIAWLIMDELKFTGTQRITAAIPMILLPGLVWQSQDARYYAGISLLFIAAIWFAIKSKPLGLLACMGLLPYIHPTAPAYAIAALLIAWMNRMRFWTVVKVGALALVAWMPRLIQAITISNSNGGFWLTHISLSYALEQTAQAFAVNTLNTFGAALLIGLLAYLVIQSMMQIFERRDMLIVLTACLVPTIIMLVVSIIKPVYFYRPEQPTAIALCLLIGLTLAPASNWKSKVAPILGSFLLLVMVANYNAAIRGGYIDRSAAAIRDGWHDGDRIVYVSLTAALPFDIYLHDLPACLLIHGNEGASDFSMPGCTLDDIHNTWLVWPQDISTDQLVQLTNGLIPVSRSQTWQIAPVEVYYIAHLHITLPR